MYMDFIYVDSKKRAGIYVHIVILRAKPTMDENYNLDLLTQTSRELASSSWDTFLESSPNLLNVMCLKQLHNSKPYRSLVDAVCEMDYSVDTSWKKIYTAMIQRSYQLCIC